MEDQNDRMTINTKLGNIGAQKISLYLRDGKYYWTIKSCGFDSLDDAFQDASIFCGIREE